MASKNSPRIRAATLLCALALLGTAIATPSGRMELHRAARAVRLESTTHPVRVNEPMRAMALRTLDDRSIVLNGRERRTVVYNVFTSWCTACREEMPDIVNASRQLARRGVITIGIDQADPPGAIAQFTQAYGVPYPIVVDNDRTTNAVLGVSVIPATVVVRDGIVRAIVAGPLHAADIEHLTEER